MGKRFLELDRGARREILVELAGRLGRAAKVLEKDVWVCWALGELFTMPERLPMAFKGGTSLSKVFDAIQRFSEDIDITIEYSALGPLSDPFAKGLSGGELKRISADLRAKVTSHLDRVVVPHLTERMATATREEGSSVTFDGQEKVTVTYPSALDEPGAYIAESVLLEFGGRNTTLPRDEHRVAPYIAAELSALEFPVASPMVLSPLRTFWEKATLIHVECGKAPRAASPSRISRHWYDVTLLADHTIGSQALLRRDLLEDVVRHKKVFFKAPAANYDDCLSASLRLVPQQAELRAVLRADFKQMEEAGMFYVAPPSFEKILERLADLENEINASNGK